MVSSHALLPALCLLCVQSVSMLRTWRRPKGNDFELEECCLLCACPSCVITTCLQCIKSLGLFVQMYFNETRIQIISFFHIVQAFVICFTSTCHVDSFQSPICISETAWSCATQIFGFLSRFPRVCVCACVSTDLSSAFLNIYRTELHR